MKKITISIAWFILMFISVTNLCNSQAPVAYYPFNGNANDASGNGLHGTVTGAILTSDRFGNANSAYSFDGTGNTYISVSNNSLLQLSTTYTLSAWVKPNGFYTGTCQANFIIAKGANADEGHYDLQYGDFLDGNCSVYTPANENFASNIRRAGSEQAVYENPSTNPVSLSKWYYVVATSDGSTLSLYINGKLRATQAVSGTFGTLNTGDLYIGKSIDFVVYPVNGIIDEVKIYNVPLTATQVFDTYVNDLSKPGSGNALVFDPYQSEYIEAGNNWDQAGSFTFETWVKRTSTVITDVSGQAFMVCISNNGWGTGINLNSGAGAVGAISLSKIGISQVLSSFVITDLKWHHVAFSYNAGTNEVIFYLDGVADSPISYSPGGFNSGNSDYRIGGRNVGVNGNYMYGALEEMRIWEGVVLTQAQIRDWMCRKISSSHPAYSSLKGYFRFDEGSGTETGGYNAKFGTLVNTPAWQTSGAPLGDAAAHDFVNATKTANISAASGENFEVTSTSGSPSGILVYRVDEAPNSNTGAYNGGNNKYFGVFQSGGTSPQYTAVYNYTGNPLVNGGNESSLRLAKRTDNSVTIWTQMSALPNEAANTITVTGESTEYILGQLDTPLPVILLNFAGSKCNNNVCLLWSTENEQNFSHFEVEKSINGNNFRYLTSIAARNQVQRTTYNSTDISPFYGVNFYRLKIVNIDGSFSYSGIVRIDIAKPMMVTVQPNPATDMIFVKEVDGYTQLRIIDMSGRLRLQKKIQHGIEEVNISSLPSGMYLIQLMNEKETTDIKLIIQ